jgi:hypothetical protein
MADVMTAAQDLYNLLKFNNEPPPFKNMPRAQEKKDFDDEDKIYDRNQLAQAAATEMMKQTQEQSTSPQVITKTVSFNPNKEMDNALVDMVGRLSELSINDKEYAVAYVQLWSKFPDFTKNMPTPKLHVGGYYVNNQGQTVCANQQYVQQPGSGAFAPARPQRLCFFCNKPVPKCYGIRSCIAVQEYPKAGKIQYNGISVKYPNGNRVATHPNGMKAAVDEFLAWQASQTAKSTPQFFFMTQKDVQDTAECFNFTQESPKEVEDPDFEAVCTSVLGNAEFVGAFPNSYNTQSQSQREN